MGFVSKGKSAWLGKGRVWVYKGRENAGCGSTRIRENTGCGSRRLWGKAGNGPSSRVKEMHTGPTG